MKKNIDEMTAKLFTSVKTAYLRECSGLVRNNGKCQPVTVDMMAQLLNGRPVDKLQVAEGTDPNKVIDLMEGYRCGLASLPRIYKQVARLAGETCEKITVGVGAALNAYGLTDEQLKAKENKKVLAVLKKYCPAPRKRDSRDIRPFSMGVYHDSRRQVAVFTDAHIMIVAPWLYNPDAAGLTVTAAGSPLLNFEDKPIQFPNWAKAVPDYSYKAHKSIFSVHAGKVAETADTVAGVAKSLTNPTKYFIAARYDTAADGLIALNYHYSAVLPLISQDATRCRLYFRHAGTPMVGYMADGGFILVMPSMVGDINNKEKRDAELALYADNKTVFADAENDMYLHSPILQADADSLPLPFLACCPEVEKVEETTAADADTQAPAEVEKEETPAAPCVALVPVAVAAEPMEEAPAATVTDADVLAQAARIKAIYDDLQAEADSQPAGMSCDDLPDTTPIYTAADVEKMIEEATADTYTAEEVAALVAAAVAEERARHTRRRFSPRLRPVLRRLGRVAAVVLPLLIVALFIGASTASAPAADAAAVTTCQAAEKVAHVVELPAVTVTASSLTDAPAAPSLVKKLAAPSPVKNAAADAVTLPNQKTASDIATATAPAADNADSLTTAPAAPLAPAADADGLTICEGTPWAYTMMNWA